MWLAIFIAQHYSHAIIIIIIARHVQLRMHHGTTLIIIMKSGDKRAQRSCHAAKSHQAKKTLIEESQSILELQWNLQIKDTLGTI